MDFGIKNPRILESCDLFVVATPWNWAHFDLCPFGVPIAEENRISPLLLDSEPFLRLLERLDALTFGPEGMPMPRWVFYDGSELPGGIAGFGRRAERLTAAQRAAMRVPLSYEGLVPFSMYIAIPMLPSGSWMGHNLASLNGVFPEAGLSGLASVTKAFGLRIYRARYQFGATQWRSRALHIHTKFGPLDLVTAYTPAHSDPMTLTYRVAITLDGLRHACGDPNVHLERLRPHLWLDVDDVAQACRLQDEIEGGARYCIADRPRREGERLRVPIARRET